MKKRLIAALLAASILIPSGSALALRLPKQHAEQIYSTSTYINPLYQDEMTAAQLKTTQSEETTESSTNYLTSEEELCDQLREELVQRKSTITLHYQSNTYDKTDATRFLRKQLHTRENRKKAIISNGSMPDGMPRSRGMWMAIRII